MILVDANLLIYACIEEFPQHKAAKSWLDGRLNSTDRVGMPWASLLAFVRIASNPRFFEKPLPIKDAWRQVQGWLDLDTVWIPEPTERHREVLGEVLEHVGNNANLVPDAHLAALAIEHKLTLCSADQGFARFADLSWENPLKPPVKEDTTSST
ncbi:MAG: type II toxin-antitoxin system VapC family toxin [bacterium]|nr:type II toxin-antitoxin system VapC family toxin [bacterium]